MALLASVAVLVHLHAYPAGAPVVDVLEDIGLQGVPFQYAPPARGLKLAHPIASADYYVTTALCAVLDGTGYVYEWYTPDLVLIIPETPRQPNWVDLCVIPLDGWGSPAWIHAPRARFE